IHSLPEGHAYSFLVRCSSCSQRYAWEIDLTKELEVKSIDEVVRERLLAGLRFEANVAGKRVEVDVGRGTQGESIRKQMKAMPRRSVTEPELIAMQLVRVDGLSGQDPRSLYRFALDLDWGDVLDLYHQMQDVEWGYKLDAIETRCDSCGWEQEI